MSYFKALDFISGEFLYLEHTTVGTSLYKYMKKKKDKKKSGLKFVRDIGGELEEIGDKKSKKIGNKLRLALNVGGEPIETESFKEWLLKLKSSKF